MARKLDADRILSDIGRRIAEVRKERGWKQREFAEAARVSINYIKLLERGRQNLTLTSLVGVANVLGTDLRSLTEPPQSRERRRPGRPRKVVE